MGKRLYIRNLSDLMDSSALDGMFSTVGDVMSATVEFKNIRGTHHRVGYVEMSTEQQALDSIERFHGQVKDGLVLVVTEDKPHVPDPNFAKKMAEAKKKQHVYKPKSKTTEAKKVLS